MRTIFQKAMVVVVLFSIVFLAATSIPTPAKAASSGGMSCGFFVDASDPTDVTVSNIHALVGDIGSVAVDGGTVAFSINWNDGSKPSVVTATWKSGAFGVSASPVSHSYDILPRSINIIMTVQHSRGPSCTCTGRADIMGGTYLIGLGGIISAVAAIAITEVRGNPSRPTWWRALKPGVPYFMTDKITSLLDMPRPWRPLDLNAHKIQQWPTFQMVAGQQSDPWAQAKCPACNHTGLVYTAWGVGCKNPGCRYNQEKEG